MQPRGFLALAAATLVLVVLAIVALANGDRDVSSAALGAEVFPKLGSRLAAIDWVQVSKGARKVNLARIGHDWFVVNKGDYPAAAGSVDGVIRALAGLRFVAPKTARPQLYDRLGVGDPAAGKSTLVTLQGKSSPGKSGNGKPGAVVAALIVGKDRANPLGLGEEDVYVRKPAAAQSWRARGALDLPDKPIDWIDRQLLDIAERRIATVTLTQPDGSVLALSRAKPGAKIVVVNAPAGGSLKSEAAIDEPATALAGLDFTDVRPAADLPVPKKGVTIASFATFDGLGIDLRLLVRGKKDWVAITASGSGKAVTAAKRLNARVHPWVYAIAGFRAKMLETRLAALVMPAASPPAKTPPEKKSPPEKSKPEKSKPEKNKSGKNQRPKGSPAKRP